MSRTAATTTGAKMSLDASDSRLTQFGRVIWDARDGIRIEGFDGEGCTCRDIAALALVHAIKALNDDLILTIQSPGASTASVD